MASKKKAEERRQLANNPSVHPDMRRYIKQLNAKVVWGSTTTTTTTTSSV